MSKHDEELLQNRLRAAQQHNQQLVRALKDVCAIVEEIPEKDRVRLGLYSMPAFNIAQALIKEAQ